MIRQAIALLVISCFLSLGLNWVRGDGFPVVGEYRQVSLDRAEPVVPPEAEAGDPPFIAIDVAYLDFTSGHTVFVDCREPEEFECGTIPGSINIPFDHLPEDDDLGPYFDSLLGGVASDQRLILFCSGEECDLSLHLGRNLQFLGYTDMAIFFGGSREWERAELDVQRRRQCGE